MNADALNDKMQVNNLTRENEILRRIILKKFDKVNNDLYNNLNDDSDIDALINMIEADDHIEAFNLTIEEDLTRED